MSLVTPLVKPLTDSEVKPLVNNDAAIYAARAALVEKWPFKNSLIGKNGTAATFTRASAEIYENVFGQYQKYATDAAAYGVGITQHPAITNKCTNYNLNPTDLTNVTTSGSGAFSVADMSSFLSATKFANLLSNADINGNMIKLDNTGAGGVSTISFNGAAANTNTHSLKVFVYVQSGAATVKRSSTTTGQVALTASSALQEVVIEGFTASAADVIDVVAADNAIIYAFANMLTETTTAPKQLIECSGASGNVAQTDTQLPTTGFPVNDCSYFFYLPKGIVDNSANQVIFDSFVDANNYTRAFFESATGLIAIRKAISGVTYDAKATYTADGTPVYGLIVNDSVNGMTIFLSNGNTATNSNTGDFPIASTSQLSSRNTLAVPLEGEQAQFGVFNEIVTLEGARRA